jgi:hypothetical protein
MWSAGLVGSSAPGRVAEGDLLRRLLFAAYFFEVGLLLLIVPWSTFWDRNVLLEAIPAVYRLTRSEFVRGAVSGLGALNLGVGLAELAAAWLTRHGSHPESDDPENPFPSFTGSRGPTREHS